MAHVLKLELVLHQDVSVWVSFTRLHVPAYIYEILNTYSGLLPTTLCNVLLKAESET